MPNNVFIVSGNSQYKKLFTDNGWVVVSDLYNANLILFTGGEDVWPILYNEHPHPTCYFNAERDGVEKKIFEYGVDNHIPMVGICRGGQFLNVMSGGKMFQHVSKHTNSHFLRDILTGKNILVTSTHHQMMRPGKGGDLVAVAREGGFKQHSTDITEKKAIIIHEIDEPDVEVVFYKDTNCLCFQPHPEHFGQEYEEMKEYFFSLIKRYFKKGN